MDNQKLIPGVVYKPHDLGSVYWDAIPNATRVQARGCIDDEKYLPGYGPDLMVTKEVGLASIQFDGSIGFVLEGRVIRRVYKP